MIDPATVIEAYIAAKDGNRPWQMPTAFASGASLSIEVRTDAIAFPSSESGVAAITDTLVRRFSQDFENVYTFCLTQPPEHGSGAFSCSWLVGMSRRDNGEVRVGHGRYDWRFEARSGKASRLHITIEEMVVLPADTLSQVMGWLGSMPYPWCGADRMREAMPDLDELRAIDSSLR